MTIKEWAKKLDGRTYGYEVTRAEEQALKDDRLVVVFGASDDLAELRGAIYDEIGCYEGGVFYVTHDGVCCKGGQISAAIKAVWCKPGTGASWCYETDIPHETFHIMEDDSIYCIGIVFSQDDLPNPKQAGSASKAWIHLYGDEWRCPACGYVISTEGSWEHPLEVGNLFCRWCGQDLRKGLPESQGEQND